MTEKTQTKANQPTKKKNTTINQTKTKKTVNLSTRKTKSTHTESLAELMTGEKEQKGRNGGGHRTTFSLSDPNPLLNLPMCL